MFKNLDISAEKTQLVPGWTTEESGLNLWQEQVIFLAHSIHTGTGAHPVSCLMGMGGLSLGVNQSGHGADHTGPSDADVEKV